MSNFTEQQVIEMATAYAEFESIRISDLEDTGSIMNAKVRLEHLVKVQDRLGIQMLPTGTTDRLLKKIDRLLAS